MNVWRILRSEVKLPVYSYQAVAYHLLRRRVPDFSDAALFSW